MRKKRIVELDKEAEEFRKKQDEFLEQIPHEFHKALKHMAWEESHAHGYNEVLETLDDMIFHLKPAIEEFEKRLLENQYVI